MTLTVGADDLKKTQEIQPISFSIKLWIKDGKQTLAIHTVNRYNAIDNLCDNLFFYP